MEVIHQEKRWYFPDPPQTGLRILISSRSGLSQCKKAVERSRQIPARRPPPRLSPFTPVGGLARCEPESPAEKKPAVLHGLDDKAAHAGHALLNHRPFGQFPAIHGLQPSVQFLPDSFVRPSGDVIVWRAL